MDRLSIFPTLVLSGTILLFLFFLFIELRKRMRGIHENHRKYSKYEHMGFENKDANSITFDDSYLESLYNLHKAGMISTLEYDRRVFEYRKKEKWQMRKIIMSACLAGENCKYSGGNNLIEDDYIRDLIKRDKVILVCPEVLGGLCTPRPPAEIIKGRVINKEGVDVTREYVRGAKLTLSIANDSDIVLCLMKERSPSCGVHAIYDGTFSDVKIPGSGICSAMLKNAGYDVYSEIEINEVKKILMEAGL